SLDERRSCGLGVFRDPAEIAGHPRGLDTGLDRGHVGSIHESLLGVDSERHFGRANWNAAAAGCGHASDLMPLRVAPLKTGGDAMVCKVTVPATLRCRTPEWTAAVQMLLSGV